jgi:hypothetical protein
MRHWLLVLGAICMTALLVPGVASAKFWGPGHTCFREPGNEGHHCYAIEEWNLAGYPTEYGDGAVLFDDTKTAEVPGWSSGDEVSDEVWLAFNNENYLETGVLAGRSRNCCTLYPFYAHTRNNMQEAYVSPSPAAPKNEYDNHFEIYDPSHTGYWGIWWGGNGNETGNQVWASGGGEYPDWFKTLENGMEAAANSQPYNWGRTEVASVEPPSDSWTEWLSGYGVPSKVAKSEHQCVYRNPESNHYGNIEFSTCIIEE